LLFEENGKLSGEKKSKKQENIKGTKAKNKLMSPSEARLQKRADDDKIIKRIKIIFAVVIIIAIAGTITGVFLAMQKPMVAWFGNEKLSIPEFKYILAQTKTMFAQNEQFADASEEESFWQSNVSGEPLIELAKTYALTNANQIKVCAAMAREQGIKLTSEEKTRADTQINSLIQEVGGDRVMAGQYAKQIYGATLADLKKTMEQIFLSDKYINAHMEGIEITDDEALARYNENIDSYESATVRHILINYEGTEDNPRTKEESEALANDTLRRVNEGEDFATLVTELSEDPGSVENGGEYTFTKNDSYVQEFKDWSFAAAIGDKGIVETQYGYHVMELISRTVKPFEEVKDDVVYQIETEKRQTVIDQWIQEPKYEKRVNDSIYQGIS
jgi:parvulin-like peptidyl-prolyl isomerase